MRGSSVSEIKFRIRADEKQALSEAADRAGMTLSGCCAVLAAQRPPAGSRRAPC
jgi:hypothetical protein